jgi:glucose/mannose-6-phosphate isomerase
MQEQRPELRFESRAQSNPAKQVAGRLHGRLPVVIGAGVLVEAAYRWKTQLNENSKCWAVREELPELNHNSIAGFGLSREAVSRLHVVLLWHAALHPRLLLRCEATEEALAEAGVSHERVEVQGAGPLAQVLSAVYLGDFVSYYLALLNGVEPSPVEALDRLKTRLAAVSE